MGMNMPEYNELTERSSRELEEKVSSLARKLEAKQAVEAELEAMRSEEKILMMSEEECQMIRAFRAFRLRCKPGGVFKWQTVPSGELIASGETGLVRHPQEVE